MDETQNLHINIKIKKIDKIQNQKRENLKIIDHLKNLHILLRELLKGTSILQTTKSKQEVRAKLKPKRKDGLDLTNNGMKKMTKKKKMTMQPIELQLIGINLTKFILM